MLAQQRLADAHGSDITVKRFRVIKDHVRYVNDKKSFSVRQGCGSVCCKNFAWTIVSEHYRAKYPVSRLHCATEPKFSMEISYCSKAYEA